MLTPSEDGMLTVAVSGVLTLLLVLAYFAKPADE
jgi:hypothetical protein